MGEDIQEYLNLKELLIDDIDSGSIGYLEALRRTEELWLLLPHKITISANLIKGLMDDKFKDDPKWIETNKK